MRARRPLARTTPLTRARLRVKALDPAVAAGYATAREAVWTRCAGRCDLCSVRLAPGAWHAHHRRPRSAGRLDCPSNLLGLCPGCHGAVHSRPAQAVDDGRIISGHDQRTPAMVPVLLLAGWSLLDAAGRRIPLRGMDALSTVE